MAVFIQGPLLCQMGNKGWVGMKFMSFKEGTYVLRAFLFYIGGSLPPQTTFLYKRKEERQKAFDGRRGGGGEEGAAACLPAGFLHCQVLEEASKGIALILYFQPFLLSHNFGSCYPFGFLLWLAFKDIRTWWCTLSLSPCIEQQENPMMTRPYETHQRRRRTMQKKTCPKISNMKVR
ncbi:Uncharacterized protein TCM_042628 [Theobroma cacao]|uniref:Uncharacterized protein n=1 Tax=Theobroma cacao TaxID=3641 RepID=A0A061FLG4_THECC|nr:Uncharacterized protein TCM_042628 [Theobroma cacao]